MTATTKKIQGYDVDGECVGTFQPVRCSDGSAGWQIVDEAGKLLGYVDGDGQADDAFAAGNRTWELCEETPIHTRALRLMADDVLCPTRFVRE